MAYKSPTEINWSAGAGEGVNYVNEVTNGIFSNFLLFSVYIIILWGFYKAKGDLVSGFAVAGFTTTIIALIMWIGGWVTWITFGVCVGLTLIAAAILLIDQK